MYLETYSMEELMELMRRTLRRKRLWKNDNYQADQRSDSPLL